MQHEWCLKRILALPGRIVSVVYKLDDGSVRIDEYEEAIDALEIVAGTSFNANDDDEAEGGVDDSDLDPILEAASRPLLYWRIADIWQRVCRGLKFSYYLVSTFIFTRLLEVNYEKITLFPLYSYLFHMIGSFAGSFLKT